MTCAMLHNFIFSWELYANGKHSAEILTGFILHISYQKIIKQFT